MTVSVGLPLRQVGTCRAVPSRAVPGRAGAVPCRAAPCRAVPCRAGPGRAVPCRAVPCRAVPWCAVPGRAVRAVPPEPCRAGPCRAVPWSLSGGEPGQATLQPEGMHCTALSFLVPAENSQLMFSLVQFSLPASFRDVRQVVSCNKGS